MLTARWHIRARGCRRRRKIALTDHAGEVLARLSLPRRKRRRRRKPGTAEDAQGGRWTLQYDGDHGVELRSGGLVAAKIEGKLLDVGSRRHGLRVRDDGPRSASIGVRDEAEPLLRMRSEDGHGKPWATLYVHPDLEQPLPTALAVSYLLLCKEADEAIGVWDVLCELFGSL